MGLVTIAGLVLRPGGAALGADLLLDIAEPELSDGGNGRVEGPPFLLAVDLDAGVVGSALSVAKQVRYVGSFPSLFIFSHVHAESVEEECRKSK